MSARSVRRTDHAPAARKTYQRREIMREKNTTARMRHAEENDESGDRKMRDNSPERRDSR